MAVSAGGSFLFPNALPLRSAFSPQPWKAGKGQRLAVDEGDTRAQPRSSSFSSFTDLEATSVALHSLTVLPSFSAGMGGLSNPQHDWQRDPGVLLGLTSMGLGAKPKSLVDLIQVRRSESL